LHQVGRERGKAPSRADAEGRLPGQELRTQAPVLHLSIAEARTVMSNAPDAPGSTGPRHRTIEMGVALFIMALGAITMFGSLSVGIGWAAEGPQSGFFPFYVGLMIVIASAINFLRASGIARGRQFAEWGQIAQVRKVVIPMAIYVAAVPWIGI